MAKNARKTTPPRLNIYLPDPAIRRQVKAAAAKRDVSISEYCLRAITTQLIRDGERTPDRKDRHPLQAAVAKARRFQAQKFGGRVFAISSSDLIREAREGRSSP